MGGGVVTSNFAGVTPFGTYYEDGRIQYLYLASELTMAGASAGDITEFGFYFTSAGSINPTNVNLKIGTTSASVLGSSLVTGLTTVYSASVVAPTVGNWHMFPFDVPFAWDGVSNIVIEVCFDNTSYASPNWGVMCTEFSTTDLRTFGYYADGSSGCTMTSGNIALASNRKNRPNGRFVISSGPCSGPVDMGTATATPVGGLPSTSFTLSVVDAEIYEGVSYQWQSSPDNVTWTDIPGATSVSYSATASATPGVTYYRLKAICTATMDETYSESATFTTAGSTINMASGTSTASHSVCNVMFYDNGGPSSNYSNSMNSVTTLYPADLGSRLQVTFMMFNMESGYDSLYIYDGSDISAPLIGAYSSTSLPNGGLPIASTAVDGSLTFRCKTDVVLTYAGWVALVECKPSIFEMCTGAPSVGNAVASSTYVSGGSSITLSVDSIELAGGLTYQWQISEDEINWTNITGAIYQTSGVTVPNTSGTYYYRLKVECTSTAEVVYSTPVEVTVYQLILHPTGSNTTVVTCDAAYFDNGGATGNYSTNVNTSITFVPSSGLSAIQLTFTDFNLENGWDYMYIYDGPSDAYPLIGTYTGSTLPNGGAPIVSSSLDGSLTVKFVSDETIVYSGWMAVVSCVPTTVDECEGIPDGGVAEASNTSPMLGESVGLTSTGVTVALSTTYQWQVSEDGITWTDVPGATDYATTITPTIPGMHYYRLRVECLTSSEVSYSDAVGVYVQNLFLHPKSGNISVTACDFLYYDDGDPSSSYSVGYTSSVTFYPAIPGAKVQLTFSAFSTENCCDTLSIYDGNSMTAPLIGQYRGTTLPNGGAPITSTAADGSLTVRFRSDVSITSLGWVANVSCYLECTPNTTVASYDGPVCAGTDVQLYATSDVEDAEFSWTGPGGFTSSEQNPLLTGTTTAMSGTYIVEVTADGACTVSDTIEVVINPAPDPITMSEYSVDLCPGSSVTITASGGSGQPFVWSPAGGTTSGTLNENYTVSPTVAQTKYYASVTNAYGCSVVSDTVVVRVSPIIAGTSATSNSSCTTPNGSIYILGLEAGEIYTVSYDYGGASYEAGPKVATTGGSYAYIVLDSLYGGLYSNIVVTHVASGCSSAPFSTNVGGESPVLPTITAVNNADACEANGSVEIGNLKPSQSYNYSYVFEGDSYSGSFVTDGCFWKCNHRRSSRWKLHRNGIYKFYRL